jgi:hypothetical protein
MFSSNFETGLAGDENINISLTICREIRIKHQNGQKSEKIPFSPFQLKLGFPSFLQNQIKSGEENVFIVNSLGS